jgi:hypothetical protein
VFAKIGGNIIMSNQSLVLQKVNIVSVAPYVCTVSYFCDVLCIVAKIRRFSVLKDICYQLCIHVL